MHSFANPTRILRLNKAIQPWAAGLCVLTFALGLYFALFASPSDYQQSEAVRIMYVHVPAAWMAMICYTALALASASALIWRHIVANIVAKATAPIGTAFTLLALGTGSLWGKPIWGTWWVWDARLTSVLILFFLYLGYMVIHDAFDDVSRGARAASILAVVGAINIPIIKFSVNWWNTLHQPASVVKLDGPAVHSSMMTPLLLMAVAYIAFYVWMLTLRIKAEINIRKIRALQIRKALI